MNNGDLFHLVEWLPENGVVSCSVVPNNWVDFDTNTCRWPRNATAKLIEKSTQPLDVWPCFGFTKVVFSTTSFDKAREKERRYLEKSDLDSTDQENGTSRKRKPNKRLISSDSESADSESETGDNPASRRKKNPQPPPISPFHPRSEVERNASSPLSQSFPSSPTCTDMTPPSGTGPPPVLLLSRPHSSARRPLSHIQLETTRDIDLEHPGALGSIKVYFEALLRNQEKILHAVNEIYNRQGRLEMRFNSSSSKEEAARPALPDGYTFPLELKEDLCSLDQTLSNDATRKQLERHLYNLGGRDYRESIRFCGACLMKPQLQGLYNLTGTRKGHSEKSSFNCLAFTKKAMFNAVFDRHQISVQQFNSYISEWLCTWRDREGKRSRPAKGPAELLQATSN